MWGIRGRKLNKQMLALMQNNKELEAVIDLMMAKNQLKRDKLTFDLKAINSRFQ
jgi:hypothetical protein